MVRGREYQDRRPPRLEMLTKNPLLLDSPLSIEVALKTKDGPQPQEKRELWRQINPRTISKTYLVLELWWPSAGHVQEVLEEARS